MTPTTSGARGSPRSRNSGGRRPPAAVAPGAALAFAAFGLGVAYAAVSAYWGLGGTGLLNTIGGTLAREGRAGSVGIRLLLWCTVLLKCAAAVAGIVAITSRPRMRSHWRRRARRTAWTAAVVLTAYGAILTAGGLLVELDVVHPSGGADRTALRWHAFLWDPWFLVWGLLLTAALVRSRSQTPLSDGAG